MFSEVQIRHFWRKVDKTGSDECWPWLGYIQHGYGHTRFAGRKTGAHRVSYELHKGPIPSGLVIDHICRNRRCVNPAHLRAVTPRENVLFNSESLTAKLATQTHCKRGHSLSGDNLYVNPKGFRSCKICARANYRQWYNKYRSAEVCAVAGIRPPWKAPERPMCERQVDILVELEAFHHNMILIGVPQKGARSIDLGAYGNSHHGVTLMKLAERGFIFRRKYGQGRGYCLYWLTEMGKDKLDEHCGSLGYRERISGDIPMKYASAILNLDRELNP